MEVENPSTLIQQAFCSASSHVRGETVGVILAVDISFVNGAQH
jgi:hypothetical protein